MLAAIKSLLGLSGGYAWLPQARCLSSGQNTAPYPTAAFPPTPQKSALGVCVSACVGMQLICASKHVFVCIWT